MVEGEERERERERRGREGESMGDAATVRLKP